jgi:hypothetical protein
MGVKKCSGCKQEKLLNEFDINRKSPDGHTCYCKACQREKSAKYHPAFHALAHNPWGEHPHYQRVREYKWRKLGMLTADGSPPTYALWKALLEFQNNRCAICGSEFLIGGPRKKWSLDHDHATGLVRGILCNGKNGDNIALGRFEKQGRLNRFPQDDRSWTSRAQAYLDDPPYQKWLRMKAQTGF